MGGASFADNDAQFAGKVCATSIDVPVQLQRIAK
jgi:hypothetical protein